MKATHLLLEGVSEDDITTEFLVAVMDVADEQGLGLRGISVRHRDDAGE
ncbi:hypothetical protein NGM10_09605 [Halorussus salilacus]|nr:hypothetical protein [Halorussus salilacus]USZ66985.1 hypothetical protein NGM10_09605 [Halorussus salilacus]